MLTTITIKNYALIDHLNVSFTDGFTTITGETGAGKSILLGGLSLVLGKRADLSSLKEKDKKCVVEAEFDITKYGLEAFFNEKELDYEPKTILRREILPSGKSRAFVNDSPVTLDVLSYLGDRLIDVHSQHQTLQLAEDDFQLKIIDALADNTALLARYSEQLGKMQISSKELNKLIAFQENVIKEHEYNSYLLKELESVPLKEGMQEELESQYAQLSNVEAIMEHLSRGNQLLNDEQIGIMTLLTELKQLSNKLAGFGTQFGTLNQRIQSVFIEMDDLSGELFNLYGNMEADPELLEQVNHKLQLLYDLQKKHQVQEISELIAIRESLSEKVSDAENIGDRIKAKKLELSAIERGLEGTAVELRKRREKVLPSLKKQLETTLASLGMPSASFNIAVGPATTFGKKGKDNLTFLFSANKGTDYGPLKKVASGGELSRIMLTIKSILAKYEQLPTMMFDEIDTGVSGEISSKMGSIMKEMSADMQIFSITHLPQVASKGDHHFKVFKEEGSTETHTNMKKLSSEERVVELAGMLGGKELSESAIAHARELLNPI
ncbi:MAG: DNA repair protein RecN [Sediminicola sp.]